LKKICDWHNILVDIPKSPIPFDVQFSDPPCQKSIERFGHSIASFENELLIFGGYSKNSHRSQNLLMVDKKNWNVLR